MFVNRLIVVMAILTSCSVKPKEIIYGEDGCHFCSMTIVDKQHSAELVTKKGKVYKYDAIECMINSLDDFENRPIELLLVADYNSPGKLLNAKESSYIISENLPSPMGAFLSAVENNEEVIKLKNIKGGKTYSWNELLIERKK